MKKRLARLAVAAAVVLVADLLIPGVDMSEVGLQMVLFAAAAALLLTRR